MRRRAIKGVGSDQQFASACCGEAHSSARGCNDTCPRNSRALRPHVADNRPRSSMALEKPSQPFPTLRRIAHDFGVHYAATAVVAFLFATTGPVAIILSVGARGGLSESDIASWIFSAFVLNSLISASFSLLYRQPLIFLWSIPGAVLLGPALGHLTFAEAIGAFMATGVLMLLLGLS